MKEWIALNRKKSEEDRLYDELMEVSETDPRDKHGQLLKELRALEIRKQMATNRGTSMSDFDEARLVLFSALSECFDHHSREKIEEKIIDPSIEAKIRKAGNMLYRCDGMKGMRDELVWLFLPRGLGGEVEIIWNGIGKWLA